MSFGRVMPSVAGGRNSRARSWRLHALRGTDMPRAEWSLIGNGISASMMFHNHPRKFSPCHSVFGRKSFITSYPTLDQKHSCHSMNLPSARFLGKFCSVRRFLQPKQNKFQECRFGCGDIPPSNEVSFETRITSYPGLSCRSLGNRSDCQRAYETLIAAGALLDQSWITQNTRQCRSRRCTG